MPGCIDPGNGRQIFPSRSLQSGEVVTVKMRTPGVRLSSTKTSDGGSLVVQAGADLSLGRENEKMHVV